MLEFRVKNTLDPMWGLKFLHIKHCSAIWKGVAPTLAATVDFDSGKVIFAYPMIRSGSKAYDEGRAMIEDTCANGPLKRYHREIAIDEMGPCLKVEMPIKTFERAFKTRLKVGVDKPINIIDLYVPEARKIGGVTDNVIDLDKRRITLVYDDTSDISVFQDMLQRLSEDSRLERYMKKMEWKVGGGALTVTMPLATYAELTGQRIELGRTR